MKKSMAFTLSEVLITMTIIGVLAVVMINLIDTKSISNKTDAAKVYKAFEEVQQAAARIRGSETGKCPEGKFITKIRNMAQSDIFKANAYTYSYDLYKDESASTLAGTADVYNLFASYMRFEKGDLNFCDFTKYCSNNNIKAGRMAGDVYIGFEVTANTSTGDVVNCPLEYYIPKFDKEDYKEEEYYQHVQKQTEDRAGKCWGKVYVFVKHGGSSDTFGKDIFIWGLGEDGIAQ